MITKLLIGLSICTSIILVGMKLTHVIEWNWLYVLAPVIFVGLLFLFVLIYPAIHTYFYGGKKKVDEPNSHSNSELKFYRGIKSERQIMMEDFFRNLK